MKPEKTIVTQLAFLYKSMSSIILHATITLVVLVCAKLIT